MKKHFLILICIIISVIFVERLVSFSSLYKKLEYKTLNKREKIATFLDSLIYKKNFRQADNKEIVIVYTDNNSAYFEQNRNAWGDILNFIESAEPKVVLFDILFNELSPNPYKGKLFARDLIKYNNIVLATALYNSEQEPLSSKLKHQLEMQNNDYAPINKSLEVNIDNKNIEKNITYRSNAPIHEIYTTNCMTGVVNTNEKSNLILKKSKPVYKLIKNNETYYIPSLSFAGFMKYLGEDEGNITIKNNTVNYKGRIIPINNKGEFIIGKRGSRSIYASVPVSKILSGTVFPDTFTDKTVIISSSKTNGEIQATIIDNLIKNSEPNPKSTRKFVTETNNIYVILIITLISALIVFLGLSIKNFYTGLIINFAVTISFIIAAVGIYSAPSLNIYVPIVTPTFYFTMIAFCTFIYRLYKDLMQKKRIKKLFKNIVSENMLSKLIKNKNNIELNGAEKNITVLLCNIKQLTAIAEKTIPQEMFRDLDELFDIAADTILKNNGTIDKFAGDCITAYWGYPLSNNDDAYWAVKTALELKRKIDELAVTNTKNKKTVFDASLTVNTGKAFVGPYGSKDLSQPSVIGNAIDTAINIKTYCNEVIKDVIISKSTYEEAKNRIIAMDLGKISLKKFDEQVEIYEPIGLKEETSENINEVK